MDWLKRNKVWVISQLIPWSIVAILAWYTGKAPPPFPGPIPQAPPPVVAQQPAAGETLPPGVTTGWEFDQDAVAANLDPQRTQHFDRTPAAKAVFGDEDVFLWQAVRKVNNRGPPWYPNGDQDGVGCCVGEGHAHSCDIAQATSILQGNPATWKRTSVEAIYGGSRVEVGGGRLRGDGSVGAWAAEWLTKKGGLIPMEGELATFSAQRARDWGRTGVPDELERKSRDNPVKDAALVKSWDDVKKAIQQGYPIAVCSNQGFTMTRDKDGFARPSGTWNHCMCIAGVRGGAKPGGYILNSWGDKAHTGGVYPADMPVAGFWADASVIDRMVRQGDSFALSGVVGFPAQKVDWFVKQRPEERPLHPDTPIALAY